MLEILLNYIDSFNRSGFKKKEKDVIANFKKVLKIRDVWLIAAIYGIFHNFGGTPRTFGSGNRTEKANVIGAKMSGNQSFFAVHGGIEDIKISIKEDFE